METQTKPLYILAAAPYGECKLRIFDPGENSISNILLKEKGLRHSGWDLSTGYMPKIVQGEYLEVKVDNVKKIHVYENGIFVCWVAADSDYLGWPLDEEEFINKPRINPLGLIEVTYNFVNLYKKILPFFVNVPQKIRLVIQFKNMFLNQNSKIYLTPGGIDSIDWLMGKDKYPARDNDMDNIMDIETDLLGDVSRVAFMLVEKVYSLFGLDKDCIPYKGKNSNGEEIIDAGAICKK